MSDRNDRTMDPALRGVRAMIEREMVERTVPALAVGAARHGEILWEEAFGWADRENRAAADEHTMFSVASTTKSFTATALMVLHEQGRIDVDAPANQYLGGTALRARVGNIDDVTVRRIASHTSGLPGYVQFFYEDEPHPCPSMERTIRRYGQIMDLPGARFRYTNLGYGVLTHLIERVSGMRYPDFLREHVLLPLGMTRSAIGREPGLLPHMAGRYRPDGSPLPFYTFDHLGGSGLFTSVHDLLRFGLFHLKTPLGDQKRILADAALDDMKETQTDIAPGLFYGTGWWIRDDGQGHRIVEHAGGMPGVGSDFLLLPDQGLVIAAAVNGDSKGLKAEATKAVLAALAPAYAEQPQVVDIVRKPQETGAPVGLTGEWARLEGDWAGTAETPTGEVAVSLAVRKCGHVVVRVGEQLEALLAEAVLKDDRLEGRMHGAVDTDDTRRGPHTLRLDLVLRNGALSGALAATSSESGGHRYYYTLPHWTRLERK